jgi:AcrR family transcriptional regulator
MRSDASGGRPVSPQRSDAQRNRARVLAAAAEVFDAQGLGASTEEVAKAAGVGIGTVFRHFPTKAALAEALLVRHLEGMRDEAIASGSALDAGEAFRAFFVGFVTRSATTDALIAAVQSVGGDAAEAKASMRGEFRAAIAHLLSRAQQAGAVRRDVGVAELLGLLLGTARAAQFSVGDDRAGTMVVEVVLDGLKSEVEGPGAGSGS